MQGAVDRSDIYKSVELPLDAFIEKNLSHVLKVGRDIRKAEVGEELAAEEERRGSKTDEEYAEEAAARRIAREQERARVEEEARVKEIEAVREQERQEARQMARQQEEDRKRREEELEKLRVEEVAKRLELEKLQAAEEKKREEEARKEREEAAIEKRKAIERDVQLREAELYMKRKLVKEKEIEKRELFERREKDILERQRGRNHDEESARPRLEGAETDRPHDIASRSQPIELIKDPPAFSMPPPVDEKALEEAALQLLLREGREMAAKSSSKPNFERIEPLDSPHQKHAPFPKAKFTESSPLKVSSPLKSPLRKPDLPPVPKLGYSAIKIRAPPNPNYHFQSYNETQGSQTRLAHKQNISNHTSSRSRSRSKTRHLSHRPEEHRQLAPDEACWRTQVFTALRESDADTYKCTQGRRRSETHDHELPPPLDRNHRDHSHHHQHPLDPLKHDKLSRSRERGHERSRSPGVKSGKVIEYEPRRGENVHRFGVQSAVEAVDPYAPDEGEINDRENKEDKRDRGREENYRSRKPRGDSQRRGEVREEMEWSDGGRGESYRGHDGREGERRRYKDREEKHWRHEGREEKYSEYGGRGEKYRRRRERAEKYTRHEGREGIYPRHEEREDNYPNHEVREDKYPRHEEREDRFREGVQDERYRREVGRDDSRYRPLGWREEKPRVVHVAPIDRYVPGGGEPKRGKGREGLEDIDRYVQR